LRTQQRRFNRLGRAAAGTILAAFLLGACTNGSSTRTITLWHPWGGAELAALKDVIKAYQAEHPDTEVIALQVPSDRLQDKYLRSAAANGGPDLLIGATDWIGKFVQSEVLAPLDDQIPAAQLERYQQVALGALRYRGHLYALPESLETVALYYNKAMLPSGPPATLDALFIRANSRDYWQGEYLLAYNTQFYFAAGYFFGSGGKLLDGEGRTRVDSPGAVKWLSLLKGMRDHPRFAVKSDYGYADALFRERKAAMTINGPWALGDYQQVLGADLGVAPLPMVEERVPAVPFVGIKCLMFNPNSTAERRKGALAFADYFTSAPVMTLMRERAGHVPAITGIAVPDDSPLAAFERQAKWGTPLPPDPEMKEVWTPMDKAIEEVLTGVKPPRQAISDAQTLIQAKIDAVRQQ
jgi:maltose-binding protein MalE